MKKRGFLICCLLLVVALVNAQTYTPKVSKDSIGVLTARLEALKASLKVQELKIKEAEEELDVEKLRLKLLEAKDMAKSSAAQDEETTVKLNSGKIDAKSADKIFKKAKSDKANAEKALDRFNRQIEKVEDIRTQIQGEERKLVYKKPLIIYDYK
jgi:hypothetical protein